MFEHDWSKMQFVDAVRTKKEREQIKEVCKKRTVKSHYCTAVSESD